MKPFRAKKTNRQVKSVSIGKKVNQRMTNNQFQKPSVVQIDQSKIQSPTKKRGGCCLRGIIK